MTQQALADEKSVRLIRTILIVVNLVLAVAFILLRQAGLGITLGDDIAPFLLYALVGMILLSGMALVVVRNRIARAPQYAQKASLSVIAWALGEGPAFGGATFYFVTGDILLLLAGLLFMAMVFFVVPVPEANPRP